MISKIGKILRGSDDDSIVSSLQNNEKGVSPVIGVILMVAVTVALVALVTVVVFDLGGDVGASPDATVQLEADSGEVIATVLRNENVQSFKLQAPDGTTESISGSVGSSGSLAKGAGSYSVIAVMSDGSEEVLTSKDFRNIDSPTTVTGIVSYNPPAEGVKVELIDGSGAVLDSDTTGADGSYSLSGSANTLEIRVKGSTFSSSKSSIDLIDDVGISESNIPSELMNGDGSSSNPYEVETASDLQSAKYDLDAYYEVQNDIDASHTSSWNSESGFEPVGDGSNKFTGSFDGQNYKIDSLYIDRSSSDYIGLFGNVDFGSTVENVGVTNVDITGQNEVGGVVGNNDGTVSSSYATGSVSGSDEVGGVVGNNAGGSVSSSYATGSVTGQSKVGGLVGYNEGGSVSGSYATGSVSGSDDVGGLVGFNFGSVSSSYATGSVSGSSDVGGLVGFYSAGSVSSSYWDTESTGQSSSDGGTGLTTSEMQGSSASTNMSDLDFSNTWSTVTSPSDDYPVLDAFDQSTQINNR